MKYRKRPVVIDAYQLPAAGEDVPDSFEQWCDEAGFTEFESDRDEGMLISTLEGTMRADPGDWIIKGVAGEFYPCKPDIFAATYEPVSDDAPSAPQAEPCIGNDSACPCQDGDACHYKDAADGTKAWPAPQAEPKRDPLHGLAPTHRCPACGAFWRQCDDASWNLRSALCCGLCDAGRVELVRLLDEPKREPLSDEQITKGEYVLATKWGDGDPGDHWGVGFYDRLENGRHYIVDSSGKQIRGNGFRRVGRITAGVGRWLLSAAKSLEASPPGTINLWTMLTERAHGIGGSDAE